MPAVYAVAGKPKSTQQDDLSAHLVQCGTQLDV